MHSRFYLAILLSLLYLTSFAQPNNDECNGAIPLLVNYQSSHHPVDLSLSTASSFSEPTNYELYSGNSRTFTGRDVWYSFNSGAYNELRTQYDVYSSCGVRLDAVQGIIYSLALNTDYIIAVREYQVFSGVRPSSNGVVMTFNREPINASCATAVSIPNIQPGSYLIDSSALYINESVYDLNLMYYTIQPTQHLISNINWYDECSGSYDLDNLEFATKELLAANETYYQIIPGGTPQELVFYDFPLYNNSCSTTDTLDYFSHDPTLYNDAGSGPMNGNGLPTSYHTIHSGESGVVRLNQNGQGEYTVYENCVSTAINPIAIGSTTFSLNPNQYYLVAVVSNTAISATVVQLETLFSNNDCDSASPLQTNGESNEITLDPDVGTATRSTFIQPEITNPNIGIDRWYLVNNTSDLLQFDLLNSNLKYQVYTQETDCTQSNQVGDVITANGIYSVPAEPFLLRAYKDFSTAPFASSINLSVVNGASLANNDECTGATSLTLDQIYSIENMLDASPSAQTSTAKNYQVRDLWYAYTPSADKNVYLSTENNVELYKGGCGSLTLVDSDLRINKIKLSASIAYYFRVFYTPDISDFRIRETSAEISSCEEAIALNTSQFGASTQNPAGYNEQSEGNSCQAEDRLNEFWGTFAGTQEIQSLHFSGGGTKTLYSGTCNALTEILCTNSLDTLISILPGTTYFLLYQSDTYLQYTLGGLIPPEDECNGAFSLVMEDTLKRLQVDFSPLSPSSPDIDYDDYWVSFTAPASGSIYLKKARATNGRTISIYEACGSTDPFFQKNLGSSSDNSFIVPDLNPGNTYYISLGAPEEDLYYQSLPNTPNQDCNTAIEISSFDCSTDITGHSYFSELWYSLTMPAGGAIRVHSEEELDYTIYSSSCADLSIIDLVYGNILASPGSTVFIKIDEGQLFNFCLEETALLLDNIFCSTAEVLPAANATSCVPYELTIAPLTMLEIPTDFNRITDFEAWYEIEVQFEFISVSLTNILESSGSLQEVKLFTDCNTDGIVINSAEQIIEDLTIGSSIYIQVKGVPNDPGRLCSGFFSPYSQAENYNACRRNAIMSSSLSFDLCIEGLTPPAANDDCANATPINVSTNSCDQSISGDTENSYDRTFNCAAGTRELFYSLTTNEEKNIVAKVLNSNIPMYVSVRSFACTGAEIACGIDSVILVTIPDSTYYLAVSPVFETQNSTFDFCISEYAPPPGGEGFVGIAVESPVQPLQVDGIISIGAKGISFPGSIRYTGQDFEGYTNSGWKSLTNGGTSGTPNSPVAAVGDDLGSHIAIRHMDMSDNRIQNLAAPLRGDDASTKQYVDDLAGALENEINLLSNSIYDTSNGATGSSGNSGSANGAADNLGNHTANQDINMVNNRITNVATPIANNDAVNKVYLDELVATLSEEIAATSSGINNTSNTINPFGNNSNPFDQGNTNSTSDNLGNHTADQSLNMSNESIDNLSTPTTPDQATNKFYVDQEIAALENTIEQLEPNENLNFEVENIFIEQELGSKFKLNLETTENNFSVSMEEFFSGFTLERPQVGFPYIYNNERFVAIGDQDPKEQLHIYSNVPMRMGGANEYFNFEYSGDDLSMSAVHNQSIDQHFLIDYTNASGQGTSFDFDLTNQRLGINKTNPSAHIHINSTGLSPFRIENNGTLKTVFGPDGYLGIGVTNPQEAIDINGTMQITKNSSSGNPQLNLVEEGNDFVRLYMTNNSGKNIAMAAIPSATLSNSKINFNIEDAGDVLTIAGNERIGINDTTPDYSLDVEAQGGANPLRVGTSSASDTYLKILSSGDVGFGDDPTADLHLHHEEGSTSRGFRLENKLGSGEYWRMYVDKGNGNLQFYNGTQTGHIGEYNYTSGAYTTNSDRRLKEDISDLHFDWEKFMRLKPSNYFFKSDQNKRKQLGLIAQEVEQVYPEIVYKNEKTGMYKMDYSGTGVIAIKAVQELKKENEALLRSNQQLEEEVSLLKREMEEIKKLIDSLEK